jgi:diguanylate cyclase (GGDEF)-like protein
MNKLPKDVAQQVDWDAVASESVVMSFPPDAEPALPDANAGGASSKASKIMLVDDEDISIEMLQAFLEDVGYQSFVSTTRSPEALDLLRNERPDVLLLDLHMPEVNGFEILSRMQADPTLKRIPVIMLTAAADATTKLEALKLGATDFLAKPVDPSELVLRLRNTLAAKAYQDQLAYYDVLTGLSNRERFLDRLDWTIRFSRRYGTAGAVLQIGLDRFKHINEALGPGVGDRVLRAIAQRLDESLRDSDIVARTAAEGLQPLLSRMGGDEFTVLLPGVVKSEVASAVAQRILDVVATPLSIGGQELFVTCCIGVALFPADGTARDTVLKAAGVAMRHAKVGRRGSYRFFSRQLNARSRERLSLETDLRRAIERDELVLFYQPKVDLKTNRMVGAEALLRWRHPQHGIVGPASFIPLAEDTGLIMPLGAWVLNTACRQLQIWQAAGRQLPRVSINVSSHQFRQRGLVQGIRDALSGAQLDPRHLCVEITESAIMDNAQENISTLDEIKSGGVALSVDDFGTGYSSLSYLKRFPIDEMKIDRSLITNVDSDKDNAAIVTAIIAMAHSLGLRVVAEGVERSPELAFLLRLGCDECQGYLYSRPLPAKDFAALLLVDQLPLLMPAPAAGA